MKKLTLFFIFGLLLSGYGYINDFFMEDESVLREEYALQSKENGEKIAKKNADELISVISIK